MIKEKFRLKAKRVAAHPAAKEALRSLKPAKTFWGVTGVVLFFILPEVVAFIWGDAIGTWAQEASRHAGSLGESYLYKGIEAVLGEGSWFNLLFGFGLLGWLFHEPKDTNRQSDGYDSHR